MENLSFATQPERTSTRNEYLPKKQPNMVLPVNVKQQMRRWLAIPFVVIVVVVTTTLMMMIIRVLSTTILSNSLAVPVWTSNVLPPPRHVRDVIPSILMTTRRPQPQSYLKLTSSSLSSIFMTTSTVDEEYPCRSNSTHVVWFTTTNTTHSDDDHSTTTCTWQTIRAAKTDAYQYLRRNVMAFDLPFLETMGFHDDDTHGSSSNTDGLTDGMIGPVIDLAFDAKINFHYTDALPQSIFYEYVLNYANVNENRNNIRPYIDKYLIQPLFFPNSSSTSSSHPAVQRQKNYTLTDAIWLINTNLWCMLAPSHHTTDCIRFVSGQTPMIFDPMSVLTFGYGSCTGISILLVQALRTAGIPARLAGTPAWNQNVEHGNHNWVEIWLPPTSSAIPRWMTLDPNKSPTNQRPHTEEVKEDDDDNKGGVWMFTEGLPAMATTTLDRWDDGKWDPCAHFLCDADRQINQTQYFAAKLDHKFNGNSTYFPLAWDMTNRDVPAVNRTLYYHAICAQCRK